ncbi:hypothetical protein AMBR_NBBOBCOC_02719 [Lacticaseibacillus rhamnosus]|nr:hypothetical protein AMBR_NBBOBCOC_02719 [Lacticaseibacillus rhamnosus]
MELVRIAITNVIVFFFFFFFFQAEDGIRDSSTSRGLGDVYKRQFQGCVMRRSYILSEEG